MYMYMYVHSAVPSEVAIVTVISVSSVPIISTHAYTAPWSSYTHEEFNVSIADTPVDKLQCNVSKVDTTDNRTSYF